MRILAVDIETAPALVYTWTLREPIIGPDQIVNPGGLLCWAAKWADDKAKPEFLSTRDRDMLQRLWDLLDEADAVLHYNGERFDIPHIQRAFMEAGMTPPSPYRQIDLYKTVRRQAAFLSGKLAHVAPQLRLGRKVEHEGFPLWRRCLDGDERAWSRMRRYNIRDVQLLLELYEALRPWTVSHPSHAALRGEHVCPKCGGGRLERRGFATLTTGRYPRLHCLDCGAWSRDTKRESSTSVVQLA